MLNEHLQGIYDPNAPGDRLLLGMKGSFVTFELSQMRARMTDAAQRKAKRGELRLLVPRGFVWDRESGIDFDPDTRLQATIREVFVRFRKLGSVRQVEMSMDRDGFHFPAPHGSPKRAQFEWQPIRWHNVRAILTNPFYAGAYAYGKTGNATVLEDGRLRKAAGRTKPMEEWTVLIPDHHPGYISWGEYLRNRQQIAANAHSLPGGVKAGRGGSALLAGLVSCARCGRRVGSFYSGKRNSAYYRCNRNNGQGGRPCFGFAAAPVDAAVAQELLKAVSPLAVDAALEAARRAMDEHAGKRRLVELEQEQARYEASLAERRYAACDPDNRLIAARLERIWEQAEQRVAAFEARLAEPPPCAAETPDFRSLAEDLEAAWNAPGTSMQARQRLLRSVVEEIVADVDDTAREIHLVIHWRGGRHSRLMVKKRPPGAVSRRTSEDALNVIRSMSGAWADADIASTLNRMGMRTGNGNTWNNDRVQMARYKHGIQFAADADKKQLTMTQAARKLGVDDSVIRRLIQDRILPAEQAVPHAPWRILNEDLENPEVIAASKQRRRRPHSPLPPQLPLLPAE